MRMIYITLNNEAEARRISKKILEKHLANCTNWFPITCMYNWEGTIEEEPEVVLIVKTLESKFKEIETIIKSEISYTNCIAEIKVEQNSQEFTNWIQSIVK